MLVLLIIGRTAVRLGITSADQINESVNDLINSLQELSESVNRIHAQVSRFHT